MKELKNTDENENENENEMNFDEENHLKVVGDDRLTIKKWHAAFGCIQFTVFMAIAIMAGLKYPDYTLSWFNLFGDDSIDNHSWFVWTPVITKQAEISSLMFPAFYTFFACFYNAGSYMYGFSFAKDKMLMIMFSFMHVHVASFAGIIDLTSNFIIFMFSFHYHFKLKNTVNNTIIIWMWILIYYFHAAHWLRYLPAFIGALVFLQLLFESFIHIIDHRLADHGTTSLKKEYSFLFIVFFGTNLTTWITVGGSQSLHYGL